MINKTPTLTLKTPAQRKAFFIMTILDNPYIPHDPTIKQAKGLLDLTPEMLYGGSAGGGKSDWLLSAGLQFVEFPGYSALLLRRSFTDLSLPKALMDRAHEWLDGTDARWNSFTKTWTFPSGASLSFGYLEKPKDIYRYQSSEFQFIGFDELTQFTEQQYVYLSSRLRKLKGVDIPLRLRAASNPGGIGHDWVKARFIDLSPSEMAEEHRSFLPAGLSDNPHIDQEEYKKSLNRLDPVTRQQLLEGDWDITAQAGMFKREWFPKVRHTLATLLLKAPRKVRYWDYAATEPSDENDDPDYTAGVLLCDYDGRYVISDIVHTQANPGEVDEIMMDTAVRDGPNVLIGWEQEGGSSGKKASNDLMKMLEGYPTYPVHDTGNKRVRAMAVASAGYINKIGMVEAPWNKDFLNEIVRFPTKGVHDDQVDALSGAYFLLSQGGEGAETTVELEMGGSMPESVGFSLPHGREVFW